MHCNVGHNTPVWLQQRWQGHLQLSSVDANNGFHPKNPSDSLDDVVHWLSVQCYAILRLHYSCPVISLQLGYFAVYKRLSDNPFGWQMGEMPWMSEWHTVHCWRIHGQITVAKHGSRGDTFALEAGRHFIGGYLVSFPRYSELFVERCTFFISFTCLSPRLEVTPMACHKDLWHQKTRVFRYHIACLAVLIELRLMTDRRQM